MSWRYWQSNNNEKWRPRHQPESAARVNTSLFLNVKHICLWEHCCWASWDSKGRMIFPAGWSWDSRGSQRHLIHLMLLFVSSLLCVITAGMTASSKPLTPLSLFAFKKSGPASAILSSTSSGLSDHFGYFKCGILPLQRVQTIIAVFGMPAIKSLQLLTNLQPHQMCRSPPGRFRQCPVLP